MHRSTLLWLLPLVVLTISARADDQVTPYRVGRDAPRLTTPMWVGEGDVEAVVVLAIDDLSGNAPKYEAYLRPILDRLKQIDGRAPVSIMTNRIDPADPIAKRWLAEGVNLDVHTLTHPCPLLQQGDFAAAAATYHGGVDLLHKVEGNHPVAFRMPCCDSLNTPSPRFYAEIFNKTSPGGNALAIDSSVFNVTTADDSALPRDLVIDPDGRERFRKYLPFPSFVNTIENYPYPYVIGRTCWEFPCVVPSDWEAQHLHRPNNPQTVADLKAALDVVVLKQGVFNLVFHPHGWIQSEQVVELIDHAVSRHSKKVKFLNFAEALERLERNLLGGEPLRVAEGTRGEPKLPGERVVGADNGVRLMDLNGDGSLDVVIGNPKRRQTRLWDGALGGWRVGTFPTSLVVTQRGDRVVDLPADDARFGVVRSGGRPSLIALGKNRWGAWTFDGENWAEDPELLVGLDDLLNDDPARDGQDPGVRLRDLDGDGRDELLVAAPGRNRVLGWSEDRGHWSALPFKLPPGASFADAEGRDGGLRLVDIDEDGHDDVIFSDDEGFGVYLWDSPESGWSRRVMAGETGVAGALPKITRGGTDNGFWAHSRSLWWQNEDTAALPDHVDRRSFNDLLKDVEPRAKSPEASRRSIRVRPGFRVELAVSEPLVRDPIAFDWSADGRLWVVEMGDYPTGADGQGKPGGTIKVLEDVEGDGKYDNATTFLDGLSFPTGLLPWRGGVLIGCAPDIFYAEDRDGDGRADHREVLFTGFTNGNPQHLINGFELGLGGWVYGANGDSGGLVKSLKTGESVNIRGRDFRFRPADGAFEAESGQTQFGRHRDDFGRWFGNHNSAWAWHYVLADNELRRNPRLALPDARKVLDPDTRLYPVSRTLARFNDLFAANRATSANSPTPYRDELLGADFATSLFVGEPVHNLVHRVVVEPDGPTFAGHRAAGEDDREFLASSDNWSRFTMPKTGPDGALWVADMYRAVIEHPEWIPDDWEAKLDLRAGHDKGRIYRVVPVDRPARPIERLDRLDTAGLVAALDSPNGWRRDTAMRLLLQRGDRAAADGLRRLVREASRPAVRVQAIWTLADLACLQADDVRAALADRDSRVRAAGFDVARHLEGGPAAVGEALANAADDADAMVRFRAALALGDWDDPRAGRALARLATRDGDNPWSRAAILSSARPHAAALLAELFAAGTEPPQALAEPLFALAGSNADGAGTDALVAALSRPVGERFARWQFAALAGWLDAARGEGASAKRTERLAPAFAAARQLAVEEQAAEEDRLAAVRLLGRDGAAIESDREVVKALLRPQEPIRLQLAAVAALDRARDPKAPEVLLGDWRAHGPTVRAAVLDALLGREPWAAALLSALEDGCVPPGEIGPTARRRLLDSKDERLRGRAKAVFADTGAARDEVIARYREAVKEAGDPEAGAAVFKKTCATCHRLGGVGVEVGPDLATLSDRSTEALLVAILDPNRAVEAKYAEFNVATADGRVLAGLVAAETANSLTLRRAEGQEDVLLRSDIERMAGTGRSLMPEGLEKDLGPRDVADLIAFLAAAGPPPKEVAGNRPDLVRPEDDGRIVLTPERAEIRGSSLTLEPQYGNLGWWSAADDRAAWRFEVARPGRYAVALRWACADDSAGNTLIVDADGGRVEWKVPGTGTWDDYRSARVGTLDLRAGVRRLEVRPTGPIRQALIDLKAVELRPVP